MVAYLYNIHCVAHTDQQTPFLNEQISFWLRFLLLTHQFIVFRVWYDCWIEADSITDNLLYFFVNSRLYIMSIYSYNINIYNIYIALPGFSFANHGLS